MKKTILTLMAAMVMVMCLGVTASAVTATPSTKRYLVISKEYEVTGTAPQETFYLVQKEKGSYSGSATSVAVPNLEYRNISEVAGMVVASVTLGGTTTSGNFRITLPSYEAAGTYTYILTEVNGKTAGVTYVTEDLYLVVDVTENSGKLEASTVCLYKGSVADANKLSEITNSYSSGSLTVKKEVAGDIVDETEEFEVTVTFSSTLTVKSTISYTYGGTNESIDPGSEGWTNKEISITLKDGEEVTFSNIPAGVTYTVEEVDAKGYTPGYTYPDTETVGVINANDSDTVLITNEESISVDTGISLDSLPYILMLLVSVIGLGVLFSGKRLRG